MGLFRHNSQVSDSSSDDDRDAKKGLTPEQAGATKAVRKLVKNSGQPGVATSGAGILGFADHILKKTEETSWVKRLIPQLESATAEEEFGNFCIVNRKTGEKAWESVPIYVRAGMSLLYTGAGDQLLGYGYIKNQLYKQSVKQGKLFDQELGAYEHIESFVKTYQLESSLDQLLEPDLTKYRTFNEFFYRKLKPDARPTNPDPKVIASCADCRLTVWEDVDTAKKFWIKGKQFTIPHLLQDENMASHPLYAEGCSLAIFRLAPQDYHRVHSPMSGTAGPVKAIPGSLYTVNPMAVRNKDVDVFTANKRDVQLLSIPSLKDGEAPTPIPIVWVGAMLVGSINFSKNPGDTVTKGEDLGYFAYGGSTVIVLFPRNFMKFDADLIKYSKEGIETVVKVGEQIGTRL